MKSTTSSQEELGQRRKKRRKRKVWREEDLEEEEILWQCFSCHTPALPCGKREMRDEEKKVKRKRGKKVGGEERERLGGGVEF